MLFRSQEVWGDPDFPLFIHLETPDDRDTHTQQQNQDPRYVIYCPNCGTRWERQRDSKIIKQARNDERWCSACGREDGTLQFLMDAKHGITPKDAVRQIEDDIDHRSGHAINIYTDELGYVTASIGETEHKDGYHVFVITPTRRETMEQLGGMWIEVWFSKDSTTGAWDMGCTLEREILAGDGSYEVVDWEWRENELLGFEVTV